MEPALEFVRDNTLVHENGRAAFLGINIRDCDFALLSQVGSKSVLILTLYSKPSVSLSWSILLPHNAVLLLHWPTSHSWHVLDLFYFCLADVVFIMHGLWFVLLVRIIIPTLSYFTLYIDFIADGHHFVKPERNKYGGGQLGTFGIQHIHWDEKAFPCVCMRTYLKGQACNNRAVVAAPQ